MAQGKRGEKDPDAQQRAGKSKSCDAEKPPLAAALPVRSLPLKVPQRHGGALYAGGVPGNRGGGRAQQERRERIEAIKEALTGHVEQLSWIVGRLLEAAQSSQRSSSAMMTPTRGSGTEILITVGGTPDDRDGPAGVTGSAGCEYTGDGCKQYMVGMNSAEWRMPSSTSCSHPRSATRVAIAR